MIRQGNIKVSEIMSKQVINIDHMSSLKEAIDVMKDHNVRHLPVMDGKNLVGIISKSDVDKVKFLESYIQESGNLPSLSIDQIMTKNVNTIQHDDTIREAGEILSLMSYHALPVMHDENVVGMVTSTDFILHLLKHCD